MSAIAQRYYCRQCSKASLYLGETPRYCNWCGLGFLTGLPADFAPDTTKSALPLKPTISKAVIDDSMFEITDSPGSSGDSEVFGAEVEESKPSLRDLEDSNPEVVEPQPVVKPKRGRPSKKNKAADKPVDLSWFTKGAASIRKGNK